MAALALTVAIAQSDGAAQAKKNSTATAKPSTETATDQPVTTLSVQLNVVNVLATVRDKHGKIVNDLNKDDFTLTEDGRPQTIRYFSQESGLPLTLGLLVDTSMSQRRVLGKERDASYRFLDQVLREEKDQAFLIHFDREVELLQDLTSSRKKLESALGQMQAPEFVLFVNDPKLLGETYRRYLTARIREIQPYPGLPIILRARPRSSSPRR